jgi:raffinose/stachyose/melibiose transport system substrate-binding protein
MQTSRRTFLGLAAGAVAIPIAGCAPGGSGPPAGQASAPSNVNTDPTSIPATTITVMDIWTDKTSLQSQWVTAVNSAFTAKYPNIKVNRTSATFDDVNKTLKLKLSDPSTPDVVPANNGWQGIGTFAKAGLILNLDSYAKAYGWDKRIPTTIARQHQVTADGSQIGTGSFFGMPIAQGGFITVYYSREKFDKLGLKVPTTFDEFKQALATAKSGGEVPMAIGTQDQWLSTTTLFALMNVFADKTKISDFVYGIGGTAADTGMKEAGTIYQEWAKSDYLPKNFAGTSGADSLQAFVDGTGVFYFYYSDSLPFKNTATADKFGTFLLPTGDFPLQATGATNQNFSIATKSKSPDAAAAYLDFASSTEAGNLALKTGVMPFNGTFEAPANAGALLSDEVGELNAVQKTDGFVPYFDWSSPTMLDNLGAQTQLLLAGKITPDQLVEACQKDYDAFRKTQGK